MQNELSKASDSLRTMVVNGPNGYTAVRQSALAPGRNLLSKQRPMAGKDGFPRFQQRLLEIWEARISNPQIFKAVVPYNKAAPLEPTQQLLLRQRLVVSREKRVRLQKVDLGLLHPDLIAATETYPEIYASVQKIGDEIRSKAQDLLKQNQFQTQGLSNLYAAEMQTIFDKAGEDLEMVDIFRDIVAAAQPPIFGPTYPPALTFNSNFLLAWEELMMRTSDLHLKKELVRVVLSMEDPRSAPCLGMVLEQCLTGFKVGREDPILMSTILLVMDYFRDHPSLAAARAISDALAYGHSGNKHVSLPIGKRLTSPEWHDVLENLASTNQDQAHLRRLEEAQNPPQ